MPSAAEGVCPRQSGQAGGAGQLRDRPARPRGIAQRRLLAPSAQRRRAAARSARARRRCSRPRCARTARRTGPAWPRRSAARGTGRRTGGRRRSTRRFSASGAAKAAMKPCNRSSNGNSVSGQTVRPSLQAVFHPRMQRRRDGVAGVGNEVVATQVADQLRDRFGRTTRHDLGRSRGLATAGAHDDGSGQQHRQAGMAQGPSTQAGTLEVEHWARRLPSRSAILAVAVAGGQANPIPYWRSRWDRTLWDRKKRRREASLANPAAAGGLRVVAWLRLAPVEGQTNRPYNLMQHSRNIVQIIEFK